MNAKTMIQRLPVAAIPEQLDNVSASIQFDLSEPMYALIQNGNCEVHAGFIPQASLTLGLSDQDFVDFITGRLNSMPAYMSGRLKLDGDIRLAQRLSSLFDSSVLQSIDHRE